MTQAAPPPLRRVYIIGGYDWAFNILNTVEVFNPVTNKISLGIPIPEPRGDVGCSSYGSIVYVHGGYYDPSGNFSGGCHKNTTWALDVTNLGAGWVRKADMNSPRGDHAFTTLSVRSVGFERIGLESRPQCRHSAIVLFRHPQRGARLVAGRSLPRHGWRERRRGNQRQDAHPQRGDVQYR